MLELRGISKTFPGVKALDHVQLQVKPGEVHALMGENGAGKSTFLKVLAGQTEPSSGTVSLGTAISVPPDRPARGPHASVRSAV